VNDSIGIEAPRYTSLSIRATDATITEGMTTGSRAAGTRTAETIGTETRTETKTETETETETETGTETETRTDKDNQAGEEGVAGNKPTTKDKCLVPI
jgi:hypothetical protein